MMIMGNGNDKLAINFKMPTTRKSVGELMSVFVDIPKYNQLGV